MTSEQLRNSILQEAISGRLVPQDPNDEPASALLLHIREEKARLVKEGKLKKKDLADTPITEEEIPFEIPSSWAWLRISDLCYITNGFTPLRTEPRFWTNGSINWFTVEDIRKQGEIINYTTQKITPAATSQERIVRAGSTLLCCTASVGQCAITNIPLTTNQQFNALTVKEWFMPIVDDKYLYWFAKTLAPTLHSLAGQTTFEFVSVKKVGSILIPLPPLAEQKRIVAKLEELLPIVEQYGKAQKELDELNAALPARLRQSILQEAISGKLVPQDEKEEPASVLLDKIRFEKARLVKEGKLKKKDLEEKPIAENEILFEIPSSWEWVRMSSLCTLITKGTTPRGGNVAYLDKGIGFLRAENISGIDRIDTTNLKYIDEQTNDGYLKRSILHENDLLITIAGTLGRTAIVRKEDLPLNANQAISLCRWVNVGLINLLYVAYALNAPAVQSMMLSCKKITAIPNLTLEIIADTIIPLPPLAEQQRIVAKIEELFEQIDKIRK